MNFSFKRYALALGVCILGTASAQMCSKDHDVLSHNVELGLRVQCRPEDPDAYFGLNFTDDIDSPYHGIWAGAWCIDVDRDVFCDEYVYVDTYSSYDENIPSDAVDKPENLDLVNWLVNNHPVTSTVDIEGCYTGDLGWREYQEAVWKLIDDRVVDLNATDCIVDWLAEQATINGDGFEFDCTDTDAKIGVIIIADTDDGVITHQVLMAEIPLEDFDSVCDCKNSTVGGDPHFKTWSGEMYDFHGICDLTLLTNPKFMNGLGMDINVRSKKLQQWSYISSAAIRIGREIFEVAGHKDGDTYWLNGKQGPSGGEIKEMVTIAGYLITFLQVHSQRREYMIHISEAEKIKFSTWKDFIRADFVQASKSNFHGSLGLMGAYDNKGAKLGRDGVTVFTDADKFGMEWQVRSTEASFFHEVDGPQHPAMCDLPTTPTLRRRLVESEITLSQAELACSYVKKEEHDLCVFDIMATNDIDVAGAY